MSKGIASARPPHNVDASPIAAPIPISIANYSQFKLGSVHAFNSEERPAPRSVPPITHPTTGIKKHKPPATVIPIAVRIFQNALGGFTMFAIQRNYRETKNLGGI